MKGKFVQILITLSVFDEGSMITFDILYLVCTILTNDFCFFLVSVAVLGLLSVII
mgnify:FL=1